jgi:hypothetical protein
MVFQEEHHSSHEANDAGALNVAIEILNSSQQATEESPCSELKRMTKSTSNMLHK